ncbi:MAG: hypothetical protein LUO87_01310, partial [Methanomicrobiales archaeon]|nr:hypothetical protein [Methanomicrobiales archaeon]
MSKKKGPAKKRGQAPPRPEKPGEAPPRPEKPVTWGELLRDWRVALLVVLVFLSVIAIYPHVENGKLTTALQFGLDLQGGSWIQMGFGAEVVGYETSGNADELVLALQDRLDTQVSNLGDGTIEIQKYYSQEDLSRVFAELNATVTTYQEGVSRNTADTV